VCKSLKFIRDFKHIVRNFECYGLQCLMMYSDYEGETNVSLIYGRFYGPIVRPRMRMNGCVKELFFLIFGNVEPTVE
jgi:hypothetical protein